MGTQLSADNQLGISQQVSTTDSAARTGRRSRLDSAEAQRQALQVTFQKRGQSSAGQAREGDSHDMPSGSRQPVTESTLARAKLAISIQNGQAGHVYARSRYDQADAVRTNCKGMNAISTNNQQPFGVHGTNNIVSSHHRSRSVSPPRVLNQVRQPVSDASKFKDQGRAASTPRPRSKSASRNLQDRNMTSFVIGNPPRFGTAGLGDIGVFKSITHVTDNLFICGVMALTEDKVKAAGITCVINVTLEWPCLRLPGLETMQIKVDDIPNAQIHLYFDAAADKIKQVLSGGGKVLVHCMAGVSRSASIMIAYLMKHRGMSLQQAHNLLKSKRPIIRPNDGFWRQLVDYEKKLKKTLPAKHPGVPLVRLRLVRNSAAQAGAVTSRDADASPSKETAVKVNVKSTLSRSPLNQSASTVRLNPTLQQDIASSALRSNNHWTTTYGNDFRNQTGRR